MINFNKTIIARIQISNLVEASKFVKKKQVYSGFFEKQGILKSSIIPSELFIVEQRANNGQTIESRKQTLYPVNGSVFVEG